MELTKGKITTAPNRAEILDYIVDRHAALYVDQAAPLNVCGISDIDDFDEREVVGKPERPLHRSMEAPLLVDMQTANAIRTVRNALSEPNKCKYDEMTWVSAANFAWKHVR